MTFKASLFAGRLALFGALRACERHSSVPTEATLPGRKRRPFTLELGGCGIGVCQPLRGSGSAKAHLASKVSRASESRGTLQAAPIYSYLDIAYAILSRPINSLKILDIRYYQILLGFSGGPRLIRSVDYWQWKLGSQPDSALASCSAAHACVLGRARSCCYCPNICGNSRCDACRPGCRGSSLADSAKGSQQPHDRLSP